ncbi:hypothetical protein ES703_91983 [subsurface metagenome]
MTIQNNFIFFDDHNRENLLPLTFTRPVVDFRVGITTIKEKWESLGVVSCSYHTVDYLSKKFPMNLNKDNLFVNSCLIPDRKLIERIISLNPGEVLQHNDFVLAYRASEPIPANLLKDNSKKTIEYHGTFLCIRNPWDIFTLNDTVLREDYLHITAGRKSQPISNTNRVLGEGHLFIEEGAKVECATINTITGPVYIGSDAEVMEGSLIRGPFALCRHSTLKMGAKIYGATSIGPYCKVGGEVNNSVFFSYSNKAHDGFLGNSVIGEWCNLGADTNNSNLKNNYVPVKLWNYIKSGFIDTGFQFCGLIMGDHSKCGISTMFNTGTVVGVSANIFGPGFPRNFVPSYSWGGSGGFMVYKTNKALKTAEIVMKRRNISLTEVDIEILNHIFEQTKKYRKE